MVAIIRFGQLLVVRGRVALHSACCGHGNSTLLTWERLHFLWFSQYNRNEGLHQTNELYAANFTIAMKQTLSSGNTYITSNSVKYKYRYEMSVKEDKISYTFH
jgi:hypothetical protein